MVWGPLQKKDFPMFARIRLPIILPDLFAKCFAHIFSSVVSGKKHFHDKGPLKQSQDTELAKKFLQ